MSKENGFNNWEPFKLEIKQGYICMQEVHDVVGWFN